MYAQEPGAVRKQLDLALDDLLLGRLARLVLGRAIPRLVLGRANPRLVALLCGLGRRLPSLILRRALALVLVVSSRRTAAPTAPASPAPRAGTVLIGVGLVIGAILLGGRPALLSDDRVDQIVLAQTAVPSIESSDARA